jgi:hypothetical protein
MVVRMVALSLVVALFGSACAPRPRSTPCSNDGQCRELGGDFEYCLESRCVQCVGSASCGAGALCQNGECVPNHS